MLSRIQRPTIPVSLRRLLPAASFVGCADIVVRDVCEQSAECTADTVFAALPGGSHHGMDFVREALARGAPAVLSDRPCPEVPVPQCIVPDARRAYAELCQALYAYPSRRLGVVGVTGTNGKTTTTWLTRSILQHAGHPTGILGTIEYSDGVDRAPATLTTPDSKTLAAWLSATAGRQGRFAAVELSSHALQQQRCGGTYLDVAIVTNITQDHFDYHRDAESYIEAKAAILSMLKRGGLVVLNADDPAAASLAGRVPDSAQLCLFSTQAAADLTAARIHTAQDGSTFELQYAGERIDVRTSLVGPHNVSNCLAAAAAALHFGLPLTAIASGIEALACVPGRLERVDCGQPFSVYVDYAHTPDALRRVIAALRAVTPGRILCVFGAGGDRDSSKRPLMGRAAAAADIAIVTSDNPRSEDPESIIAEILPGLDATGGTMHVEPRRERAIAWALEHARPGDCVLIAGKGHERVQIVGSSHVPFDDRAVCRQHLAVQHWVGPLQQALTAG